MREPRNPYEYDYGVGMGMGAIGMIVPRGALGCLGTLFLLVLASVALGMVTGIWLVVAALGLLLLLALIRIAFLRELRRDDSPKPAQRSLPYDSELSDQERRTAMRRISGEEDEEDRT